MQQIHKEVSSQNLHFAAIRFANKHELKVFVHNLRSISDTTVFEMYSFIVDRRQCISYGLSYDMATVCCALRRRSPAVQQKRKKPPAKRNMLGSVASHKARDSGEITVANRIISFGKMPSYKCVSTFD